MLRRADQRDLGWLETALIGILSHPTQSKGLGGWSVHKLRDAVQLNQVWVYSDSSALIVRETPVGFEIDLIMTMGGKQKRGLASALLVEWINSLENCEVWLEFHEANIIARKLYEKHGFRQVGIRKNYYPDGGSAVLCTLLVG